MKKALKMLFFVLIPGFLLGAAGGEAPLVFTGTCMARFWLDALPPRHAKLYGITPASMPTGVALVPREERAAWIDRFCLIQKKDIFDTSKKFTNEEYFCLCYALAHLYDTPEKYKADAYALKKYGMHYAIFCADWRDLCEFFGLSVKLPSAVMLKKLWHPRFSEGVHEALRALIKQIFGDDVAMALEVGPTLEQGTTKLLIQGDFSLGSLPAVYRIHTLFDANGICELNCQSYSEGVWEPYETLDALVAPYL